MNRYNYYSEKAALRQELTALLTTAGDKLLEYYLKQGINSLFDFLKLTFDWQKELLFDFLVFEKKAIVECIRTNKEYFLKIVSDGKGDQIRKILGLEDEKYQKAWKEALEVLHLYYSEKVVDQQLFEKACEIFFRNSFEKMERKQRNLDQD